MTIRPLPRAASAWPGLGAALAAPSSGWPKETLRIAMTAGRHPHHDRHANNGWEGMPFLGYPIFEGRPCGT